jgi:hypothetical protein
MNHWQGTIGVLAGFLSFLCFIPYIVTILLGKTRPNRASWWIWAINGSILSTSYYFAGANNTLWLIVFPVIAQFIIALLSLKYGKGGWNFFDRACLMGASLSLTLWLGLKSPMSAIVLTLVTDVLGALPTIKKSYYEPETEDMLTWVLYVIASILNLLAIEQWSLAILLPPMYVLLVNTTILVLLLRSRISNLLTPQKWQFKKSK